MEDNPRDSLQMESAKPMFNVNSIGSSKEAIDFMGASSLRRNGQRNRDESVANYESRIELDLSLRRPNNTSENQFSGDRPSLNPSSASAFTRLVVYFLIPSSHQSFKSCRFFLLTVCAMFLFCQVRSQAVANTMFSLSLGFRSKKECCGKSR